MTDEHTDDDRGTGISRRNWMKVMGATGAASVVGTGTAAAAPTTEVGAGAYATEVPDGATAPPDPQYTTSNVSAPYPTNDWWSRLLTAEHAETLYSHPLFTEPHGSGLDVGYTDEWDVGDGAGVNMGNSDVTEYVDMDETVYMPIEPDFTVGHAATDSFDQSLVDGYGDWHVEYRLGSSDPSVDVTQVQGSPYLYLDYSGGGAELTFDAAPTVFEDRGNVLGISVGGTHYGLFAPEGTSWSGTDSATLSNDLGSEGCLSIAVLPDDSASTLDTFGNYATNFVTDTQIDWEYVEREDGEVVSEVRTTYEFTVEDRSGSGGTGTVAALYPHQHKYLADGESVVDGTTYESPRGTMQVTTGTSFTTALPYSGILPHYPVVDSADSTTVADYADVVSNPDNQYSRVGYIEGKSAPYGSTYWGGLNHNRWSESAALVDAIGDDEGLDTLLTNIKDNFALWFEPENDDGTLDSNLFFYDDTWGTLVGHIGGFNLYQELNDHHFHYGYFVKSASEVARHEPEWADPSQYGDLVELLIRDYATPVRDDDMFPFLRTFAPYAGHSFASGVNPFHLGNNQESSSEAINAYAALIRWGALTGNEIAGHSIEELGIFLYTHEIHAALEYWYDWEEQNHPDEWDREYASVVWGDGYSHSTWWTEDDEDAYAINALPVNGDKLYLGWDEAHAASTYDELVTLRGGEDFSKWPGILSEFRGFSDPASALTTFQDWESGNYPHASSGYYVPDLANSKLHTYTMLTALDALGSPVRDVVSDATFSHVFQAEQSDGSTQNNYVVYNPTDSTMSVEFSDGCGFTVPPDTLKVQEGYVAPVEDPTPPTTPTDLAATNVTDSTVTLEWTPSTDEDTGVDAYLLYVDGEEYARTDGQPATVTDLESASEYTFAVAAMNPAGTVSEKSDPVTVTTGLNSGDYEYSVTESTGAVDVEFTPVFTSNAVELVYSVDGGAETTTAMDDSDGDGTWTATVDGLSPGAELAFSFVFERGDNTFETSVTNHVFVGDDTTAPAAPADLSASTVTDTTVDLAWSAASDDGSGVDSYNVYEGESLYATADGTSTTVRNLSPDTSYTFTVTAVDRAGNESAASNGQSVTTEPASDSDELDGRTWEPVWRDEFDGDAIDTDVWSFETGGGCGENGGLDTDCTWGNQEAQYYTDGDNAWVEDGTLVIEAREEEAPSGIHNYTSARMSTSNKKTAQYGRIDVRATVPQGQGIWPALWMLRQDIGEVGWPDCGEIDIMELVGHEPSTVHGTVHGPGYSAGNAIGSGYELDVGTFSDQPHTFSITWDPDQIKWFVDGAHYHTVTRSEVEDAGNEWVFDGGPFFFIFNVAVGGEWPGYPDDTTTFPQQMRVEYIREYEAVGDDVVAPTMPSNLTASAASPTSVEVTWDASTSEDVDHYLVYLDGAQEREVPAGTTSVTLTELSEGTSYDVTVSAVDDAGNESQAIGPVTVTPGGDDSDVAAAINCGGESVTVDGTTYAASEHFTGGEADSTTEAIAGTDHDALYQTNLWGAELAADIPVPNGTYDVQLHFAELYWESTGARVFDVAVQGETRISDLDIYDEVGYMAALTETVSGVEVTDGSLTISTTRTADNPTISAVTVVPADDTPEPVEPTLSVTFPEHNRVGTKGTVDAEVRLSEAPEGLAGFDLDVTVADTGVAAITDASPNSAFGLTKDDALVSDDGASARLKASDTTDKFETGVTDVLLGTVTFEQVAAGETAVELSITAVDADGGATIEPTTERGTLVAVPVEPVGDNPAPSDPDGDGIFEDLNGNGNFDSDDVVVFFEHENDPAVTNHTAAYDLNEDGDVDFDDVNSLFDEL